MPSLPRIPSVPAVKIPRLLGSWGEDPLWGTFYDWTVEHRRLGGAVWFAGLQSDLGRLYAATEEIGRQPADARILDVPCGGGVALRGLRPDQQVSYVAADLDPRMLERTLANARRRGLAHLVRAERADVGAMPFADASFDLVVSFTGLHCFPDPRQAIREMARVLKPGGRVTGSAVLEDTGLRFTALREGGRLAGLIGPGCSSTEVRAWFAEDGVDVRVDLSGALGYFTGTKDA
ncbi:class I SAM-dependent methyltransferase [Nocardioides fonticola]|uniref:Class I SAM-dependent methyltransferase n=1 Tax=Nocardioides fonticola TaxID=450363 RepID=A0ABP7XEM2_9ACTN